MKSKTRQAVIMAAGLGTRLRPHTLTTPKPLLPVAGRPILEWNIAELPPSIEEIILVVGYLKDRIIAHFGSAWRGRKIVYVEQRELLGTGHAVQCCRGLVDRRFLVLNGDDLYAGADLAELAARDLAILAKPSEVSGRFGALRTDAHGRLLEIAENSDEPAGSLVNTGAYALDQRFFDYPLAPIRNGREFGLPQTLVRVAADHPVEIVQAGFWVPIGYPEDLAKAGQLLKEREPRS
jgi:bifunctional UDP-N-acetylglucosamine pyrophosphorylase/glucosamine-1-phosphate N-acetyltransferase